MSKNLNKKENFSFSVSLSSSSGIFLLVILNCLLPCNCNGHLASILEDGNVGGYIFRVHPKQGEAKPPFLNYARVNRGPAKLTSGESHLVVLKSPAFTHKYLPSRHLSRYYQNSPAIISSSTSQVGHTPGKYSKPIFNSYSAKIPEEVMDNSLSQEEPTFTPYIGARALSNMDKFFEHLRENLEALQKDESSGLEIGQPERRGESSGVEENYDDNNGQNSSPEKALPIQSGYISNGQEWKPIASGGLGLKKLRSFFPLTRPTQSRTMGLNMGIGRKRRR